MKCSKCGPVTGFKLDGYVFGDRILEDVWFVYEIQPDGKAVATGVTPDCQDYFEDLNKKKWLKEATKYANDVLADGDLYLLYCLGCGLTESIT